MMMPPQQQQVVNIMNSMQGFQQQQQSSQQSVPQQSFNSIPGYIPTVNNIPQAFQNQTSTPVQPQNMMNQNSDSSIEHSNSVMQDTGEHNQDIADGT